MALAGFTVGEAEGLRRAMSRKRSHAALEAYRARFIEGAVGKGVDETKADEIYDKLVGFSGFGFPKSHAAAFGLLAYQSSWLRRHYPAEFLAALLDAQPMGFYPPASLVRDAQRRGVEVLPPDVNVSAAKCVLEGEAVRVGLEYVQSVGADDAKVLVEERERGGPYRGIVHLVERAPVGRDELEAIVAAGACDSFGEPRRKPSGGSGWCRARRRFPAPAARSSSWRCRSVPPRRSPICRNRRSGSGCWPTTARRACRSASIRSSSCDRTCRRGRSRARSSPGRVPIPRSLWRGWRSRASGR